MLACLLAVVFLPPLTPDEIDRDILLPDGGAKETSSVKAKNEQGGSNNDQKSNANKKGAKGKWEKKKKR